MSGGATGAGSVPLVPIISHSEEKQLPGCEVHIFSRKRLTSNFLENTIET